MNNMKKIFYGGGVALVALVISAVVLLNRGNLDYDMSHITFEDDICTYEKGVSHSLEIEGELPEGVKVSYAYNDNYDAVGASTVNTHEVTATFTHNNSRYNPIDNMTATLIITTEHVITYSYNGNDISHQTIRYYDGMTFPLLGELINAPANEDFVWVDEDGNIFDAGSDYVYPHNASIELTAVYVYNSDVIEYVFNNKDNTAVLDKYKESSENAYYGSEVATIEDSSEEEEVVPYVYTVSPQVLDKSTGTIYDVTNIGYDEIELNNVQGNAFCDVTSFEAVVLPQTVTLLGTNIFFGCENMVSINIPKDVTSIGR